MIAISMTTIKSAFFKHNLIKFHAKIPLKKFFFQ